MSPLSSKSQQKKSLKKVTPSQLKKSGGSYYAANNPQSFRKFTGHEPDTFSKPWLYPPPSWQGSDAEYAVDWALTSLQEPHVPQFRIGSLAEQLGGHRVDEYLPERNTIIRVQGVYFHYEQGGRGDATTIEYDQFQKEFLEAQGFTVIDIDSDDALMEPLYYVKEAIEGRDHSRQARGIV